ncbi:gastric triacylglycerol lipase-like isoform X1 [Centruroides vittatus]|uniref:gastric triacylglycerol lipase-like isoform X1 n=1 Tax=Centruroides vittatus TaxID=120091 RepID=UPI00350FD886
MYRSYVCLLCLCLGLANCLDLLNILTILNDDEPDANRNITEIIRSKGYPVEEYSVQTKDGYVLSVQRIPYGLSGKQNTTNRPVAYLQHGLLESATDWVLNFPNQSLGYILADNGYDVWLGNQRGNTYSKKHVEYSTKEERFWNFTIDEFAKYDVPDTIEFILNKTNQSQVYYIGQSQGNTVVYALLSDRPDYDKIKAVLSLGPVATVGHITSPLRLLAPLTSPIDLLYKKLGYREFLPNSFVMKLFAQVGCGFENFNLLCSNVYFLMNGYNPSQLNRSRIDVYMSHYPAGSSTKNIVHFGQMMNSKKLQKFDYGPEKNIIAYNQPTPPEYKVENIRTPIALFWSSNDNLADPKDVGILREKIQNLAADYKVELEEWGHLDFIMAIEAKKYVYDELIRVMKNV